MRILADKDQIDALPDWAREFLAAGWAAPDAQGQRAALKSSASTYEPVIRKFTAEMTRALRDPRLVLPHFSFALRERDESAFSQIMNWSDGGLALAADLAQTWNRGASLAECVVCGNLILPEKGRVAITCSPACRMALHRQRKGA